MSSSFPSRPRVVLDTDTYNEVDDQFALAHLLLSPESVDLEAVYAAPFHNDRSSSPGDGMEKSYDEIQRVMQLVPTENPPKVFRGSTSFLRDAVTPVKSDAAFDLVERAMSITEGKLHVIAIAASTNVASALLLEPKIADKIVVTWLGGNPPFWPHTNEFNLAQDIHGARILLDMEVPHIMIPCSGVASHLIVTAPELDHFLAPHSRLGAYLSDIVRDYIRDHREKDAPEGGSKVIWDISGSAAIINPGWITLENQPSPLLRDDATWDPSPGPRRTIQIARQLDRDAIFADFYAKARRMKSGT